MPGGMTGFDLATAAQRRQPGLKLLFASGYARAPLAHDHQLARGLSVLRKPYRKQELARKIREALDLPDGACG